MVAEQILQSCYKQPAHSAATSAGVIDEVVVRAADYIDIGTLPWRIGCAGDGEITRISFLLEERLMKLKTTLFGNAYQFADVKRYWLFSPTNCVRGCCRATRASSQAERVAATGTVAARRCGYPKQSGDCLQETA